MDKNEMKNFFNWLIDKDYIENDDVKGDVFINEAYNYLQDVYKDYIKYERDQKINQILK